MRRRHIAPIALLVLAACVDDAGSEDPPAPVTDAACAGGGVAVGWPLRAGDYEIDQGNGGAFSHGADTVNAFAFDFDVPVGTDVIAARGGTVVVAVDGFGEGGNDVGLVPRTNLIVVDHGGGTADSYLHLQDGTFFVDVGDVVAAGDLLAKSGNSGFTSGPHLHFAVVDAAMRSQRACFDPGDVVPATGDTVTTTASTLPEPDVFPRSLLAADLFADSGIVIDNDITAWAIDGTLHVEGHITNDRLRAAVFIAPFEGGNSLKDVVVVADADGAFTADLDTAGFAGLRSLAMGTVDEETLRFDVSVLAPVVIR